MQYPQKNESSSSLFYLRMRDTIRKRVKNILDFGCGEGDLTFVLHTIFDDSNLEKIIGYDSDKSKIKKAKENMKKRQIPYNKLEFTHKKQSEKYDLVIFNFVLHHDISVMDTAPNLIDHNSLIAIIDYNMKDIDESTFKEIFNSNKELEELDKYGFEKSFQLHTRFGLDDYLAMSNCSKLTPVDCKVNSNKFLMVCQKKKEIL